MSGLDTYEVSGTRSVSPPAPPQTALDCEEGIVHGADPAPERSEVALDGWRLQTVEAYALLGAARKPRSTRDLITSIGDLPAAQPVLVA